MTPKNDEEASTSSCSEEEIHNLLRHLGIDDSEGVGLETISKQLGQLVIDEESDDDDCDSDAEEVLKTVPDSEDSEDPCLEVVTKCSPTSAVVMILEGSRNSSQEDIVNRLRERCDTLKDTVDKVKFLTERVSLVLGYPISALMYSIFTNKIQIVQFLVEELYHKCALSNSQVFHFLDQRDKDGNNLLLAMAASPLDLSDTFKLLLSFQYTYSSKKYFMVNAWATNQREETIWDILKRNEDMQKEDKERLERTLRDVIQNSEFQQSWIGDVMSGANNYREETPQRIEESLTQIAREVNDHHPNPKLLHVSQPQVVPDPNQILEEDAGHPEDNAHEDVDEDAAGDNVVEALVEAIPAPGPNVEQPPAAPPPVMMWTCSMEDCQVEHNTREAAAQCAQTRGGDVNDVLIFDPNSM